MSGLTATTVEGLRRACITACELNERDNMLGDASPDQFQFFFKSRELIPDGHRINCGASDEDRARTGFRLPGYGWFVVVGSKQHREIRHYEGHDYRLMIQVRRVTAVDVMGDSLEAT
jgi:hypothetical protein